MLVQIMLPVTYCAKTCLGQGSFAQGNRADPHPPGGDPPAQRRSHICNGTVEHTGDTEKFRKAADMTDDELAAIVGRAKLTVV